MATTAFVRDDIKQRHREFRLRKCTLTVLTLIIPEICTMYISIDFKCMYIVLINVYVLRVTNERKKC